MTDPVPADQIEALVGIERHPTQHYARATERSVHILHSGVCRDLHEDLGTCPFSLALDRGLRSPEWSGSMHRAIPVAVLRGRMVPEPYAAKFRAVLRGLDEYGVWVVSERTSAGQPTLLRPIHRPRLDDGVLLDAPVLDVRADGAVVLLADPWTTFRFEDIVALRDGRDGGVLPLPTEVDAETTTETDYLTSHPRRRA